MEQNMTEPNQNKTPRTDAQYKEYARRDNDVKCVNIDFARQLETELAEANKQKRLNKYTCSVCWTNSVAPASDDFDESKHWFFEIDGEKLVCQVCYLTEAIKTIKTELAEAKNWLAQLKDQRDKALAERTSNGKLS